MKTKRSQSPQNTARAERGGRLIHQSRNPDTLEPRAGRAIRKNMARGSPNPNRIRPRISSFSMHGHRNNKGGNISRRKKRKVRKTKQKEHGRDLG